MVRINIRHGLQPLYVLLDDEDTYRVTRHSWTLSGKEYDIIGCTIQNKRVSIGRFLLNYSGPLEVDHKDRNIFNNQKSNLRLATHSQQMANRGPKEGKDYKGVTYHKRDKGFQALAEKDKKVYYGGLHKSEIAAAKAYDKLAIKLFGEFAYLNFPEPQCQP